MFKFALGACLASSAIVSAEEVTVPKVEVGFDYSWVRVNSTSTEDHRTGNGGSAYVEYNLTRNWGLVADFGGYANTRKGIDEKAVTYLFGPRYNLRFAKWTPYAQTLFGAGHAWSSPTNTTQNGFVFAVGGGVDYNLTKRIAIKPAQVEYLLTRFDSAKLGGSTGSFGDHQNDIRYSAGIVFRFGEK
jgi:hypothetical protein